MSDQPEPLDIMATVEGMIAENVRIRSLETSIVVSEMSKGGVNDLKVSVLVLIGEEANQVVREAAVKVFGKATFYKKGEKPV